MRPLIVLAALSAAAQAGAEFEFNPSLFWFSFNHGLEMSRGKSKPLEESPRCIREYGLHFSKLDMVADLPEATLDACMDHCLRYKPNRSHVLVGYGRRLIFSDRFHCMCADEDAFADNVVVAERNCDQHCGDAAKRCGDASDGFLSVYCLRRGCNFALMDEPVCAERRPHDSHGCLVSSGQVDPKELQI